MAKLTPRSAIDAGVEAFVADLAASQRLSPATCRAYAADLAQFTLFLHTRIAGPTVAGTGAADVRAFAAHLAEQGRRPRTVSRKLAAVRGLFRFLVRIGARADDPARGVAPPATPPAAEPLSPAQVRALLRLPETDTFTGSRNRALLELLYGAGLRLEDLLRLNLSHLDLDGAHLRIVAAGRRVPLGTAATAALRAYLLRRADALVDRRIDEVEAGALFVSARGRRLRPRSVQRLVERYLRQMETGTDDGAAAGSGASDPARPRRHRGPGVLRAACEAHLIEAGADPGLVAALLGRGSVRAPRRDADPERLLARYRQVHPRA